MVPVPAADSLADLNEKILRQCVSYGNHKMASRDRNVSALYEEEKEHLLALPETVFSNLQASSGRVDKYAMVIVNKDRYSVQSGYAGYCVKVLLHADRVDIFTGTKKIAKHERSYGNNKWILDPDHYLDLRLFRDLVGGSYIKERRNVIFLGLSGRGKTHMAEGLGSEACKNKYRNRFATCYGLVNELIEARQERGLQRLLQRYARYDLLILDELGYIPFSKEGSELLFQVLAERHERGSVMITTNLGFADWTQVFGDPVMTATLLDRITHKAHIINCDWDSYRLKQSIMEKGKRGRKDT